MMRSDYNPVFPNQENYPQSTSEYWGGYPQPMPHPHATNQEPPMYPYPLHNNGGFVQPYHDPYQQAGYPPYQQMPQQGMAAGGAFPGSSVMQPMQSQQMQPHQPMMGNPYMQKQSQGFNPYDNPLQPAKRPPQIQQQAYNPYPKQQFMQKQQPSGIKSVMNQFKTQDGSMDVTKMMNTAGQMMNTVSQVSSMVKGVGGFFKV